MAKFNSFVDLLIKYLKQIRPTTILEWGPGLSTALMLKYAPNAHITSLEDNGEWFGKYVTKFSKYKNLNLMYVKGENYYLLPESIRNRKFDLVFVDGVDDLRVSCLLTTLNHLSDGGVVLLHDSERPKYQEAIKIYKVVEEENGTVVLRKW
jgi:predicted O-methyltransferase YrrM